MSVLEIIGAVSIGVVVLVVVGILALALLAKGMSDNSDGR